MAWRRTQAGNEFARPDSERGLHVEGPLTSEDWKAILHDIADELADQAKREGREGRS
jgi:hypothetical protein